MSGPGEDILHEIERSDETAILKILKIIRQAQDFRSTEDLYSKVVESIIQIYKAYYHVSIFMHTEDRKQIRVAAIAGESANEMEANFPQGYSQSIDVGIAGQVYRTRKTYISNDVSEDPLFVPAMNSRTRSELCLPIFDLNVCVGGLNVESDRVGTFTATDFYLFEVLTHALGNSITRDRMAREMVESVGALGVLAAGYSKAVVALSPEGAVKFGNSKFLPFRNVGGLLGAIHAAREGDRFTHSGRNPAGQEVNLDVEILAIRGGFMLATVRESS